MAAGGNKPGATSMGQQAGISNNLEAGEAHLDISGDLKKHLVIWRLRKPYLGSHGHTSGSTKIPGNVEAGETMPGCYGQQAWGNEPGASVNWRLGNSPGRPEEYSGIYRNTDNLRAGDT